MGLSKTRNADRPATRVRGVSWLSGENELVALEHDISRPGPAGSDCRDRQLSRGALSGHAELVIGNVRMRAILLHRAGTARRRE